jgi:transglutaminase-like putative cysteine protease
MKLLLMAVLASVIFNIEGKESPRYPVSDIPETLRKDAQAVVRDDQMVFTIRSRSNGTLHVLLAVTIFNANKRYFATNSVGYDKLTKITAMKAQVFDAEGNLIKKLKSNEITDESNFDDFYSDNRVKIAQLVQGKYPYTVEFEYELEYKFLFDIAGSSINGHEDVAVQKASYQLVFPEELRPRYKTFNVSQEPKVEKINNMISLTWDFNNIPAQKFEPYSDRTKSVMKIEAAPTNFEYEGYVGSMLSWNDFGKWIASLNKGRNTLPEETKKKAAELTASLPTTEAKIKALYEFLQNKTRYVSVQLGIGGYQPFDASLVDKTGYGDCKALSNYMVSLLESVGIKGYYTLVYAGDYQGMDVDFPSSQFNHVIVAVPNGADTVWLECTNQTNPFGYQGRFTGDRKALLINDHGATVVNTTRYPAEVNIQSTSADVTVSNAGDARAIITATYSGLQYENGSLDQLITHQFEEQKKWLERNIAIPSFDINGFSMKNVKNKIPAAVVKADLIMNRYASVSGKRMFLTPNLMTRINHIPEKVENRKTSVVLEMPYIDLDTIRFHLPEEIYPEFLPADVKIQNRYGEYEARFTIEQGRLVYVRKLKMNKGEFPAESYTELINFFRSISKADNTKLVFMTKT